MARHIEINPATHLTIGTVGEPGNRTFYIQGSQGAQLITLTIEKEQARTLAGSLETLLAELAQKFNLATPTEKSVWTDLRLRDPIESLFRVGNMGLGYNEESDQVVLVAYELVRSEEVEPNVVSFWASREQAQVLVTHALDVVKAGRPICGNCGRPIDPDGHFCPHRNGHAH
jgi:uncharacterized repeat protein (TIGR03847 family)